MCVCVRVSKQLPCCRTRFCHRGNNTTWFPRTLVSNNDTFFHWPTSSRKQIMIIMFCAMGTRLGSLVRRINIHFSVKLRFCSHLNTRLPSRNVSSVGPQDGAKGHLCSWLVTLKPVLLRSYSIEKKCNIHHVYKCLLYRSFCRHGLNFMHYQLNLPELLLMSYEHFCSYNTIENL